MAEGWNISQGPPDGPPPRGHHGSPHAYTDADRGPRLHKVLADAGVGSRRACEELIESGEVTVNGHVVKSLPAWVDPARDHINVSGRRIRGAEPPCYIMLFKPRGVICSNERDGDRRRAIDLVDHPSRARLFPVGRLDVDSSGLLLLTNDGELANRLTHPRYGVHKVYEVTVDGALDENAVQKLERGIFLAERRATAGRKLSRKPDRKAARKTKSSRLTLIRSGRDRTRLLMELREGRNRQVRRMMLYVGHKVRKLRRVQLGPLKLRDLRPGQWRELFPKELAALKRAAYRPTAGAQPVSRSGSRSGPRNAGPARSGSRVPPGRP